MAIFFQKWQNMIFCN